MNTLDLHPEELFDKAALGTLSASERIWLDGHLEQCEVCRFEQQARADFDAEPMDTRNVDSLVTRALSGAPVSQKTFGRSSRRTVALMAGTALVFSTMASFAAVAQWTGVWPKIVEVFATPRPAPAIVPAPSRHSGSTRTPERVPEPIAPVEETPTSPAPSSIEEQPPIAARPSLDSARDERAAPVRSVKRAPPPPVAALLENASTLFDQANQARVQGAHERAVQDYRGLLERFPSAPEANLTRATLGRLLLDTGDAANALTQLDAYLRSGELTLREEVLSSRAVALSRLNRTAEEKAAWSALLDSYPDSIHSARAKARLEELGQH